MLRRMLLAGAVLLVAVPVSAQQTGYYGGTAQERRYARDFYEEQKDNGIEYVSVSFRLGTLTLYPTEALYNSWLADEEKTTEELGAFAKNLLVEVRERKSTGTIRIQVKIRYPNARRSYDKIILILTSHEGLEGEVELIIK